jgi:hypothetical protein
VLPLPLLSPLALAGGSAATGGQGAAAAVTPAATRLAATGSRVGHMASGGWSGLAGSLTAKLAVTALVVIGAGYVLLGSRAHGHLPAARTAITPRPVVGETLAFPAFSAARRRRSHPIRHSSTAHPRSSRTWTARSTGGAGGREFLPERSKEGVPVVSSTATPARSRNSSRAAREFGIE